MINCTKTWRSLIQFYKLLIRHKQKYFLEFPYRIKDDATV